MMNYPKNYFILLIFLALSLIVFSCAGSQQTVGINDSDVPMEASVIFLHTNLDAESAYKKVGQNLLNRGYTFQSSDKTFKSISTEYRDVENISVRIGANVQGENNSRIVIRGWFKTVLDTELESGLTITKFGANRSPARKAWKEMYQVARSLGDSLSYQK